MSLIVEQLFAMQDVKYKQFHSKLINNIDENLIIGVRMPLLRQFAKEIVGNEMAEQFMQNLPHKYYEENNLHAFLIELIKDETTLYDALNRFLPYIDNWATCDSLRPKLFAKHKDSLLVEINKWLNDKNNPYTVRYGIEMLMVYFLDDDYNIKYLDMVASVKSSEYYINMMIAWYFATALAKQYDDAITYILNKRLDVWTHNKTIQKGIESYRITDTQKIILKQLKR